jgi:tetratricopeptide (TPR) repeat protein
LVRAHAGLSQQVAHVGSDANARAELKAALEIMSRRSVPPMVRAEALGAQGAWMLSEAMGRGVGADEAAPILEESIRIALQVQGPLSRTAMEGRTALGSFYALRGNKDAALRYYGPALAAMRTLGGPNDVRAALEEARLATWLRVNGEGLLSFADAQAMFERSLAALNSHSWHVPRNIVNEVNALYGSVLSNWGHVERGYALMTPHVQEYLAASGQSPMADFIRLEWANVAGRAGHFEEAIAAARQALELARREAAAPAVLFQNYRLLAGVYEQDRRFKEAEGVMAEYAALPGGAEALRTHLGPGAWGGLPFPLLPLLKLEMGDPLAALAMTQLLDPTRHQGRKFSIFWLIRASALCATGHMGEGLDLFQWWLTIGFEDVYEADPSLASARARMGLCALKAGRRRLALEASAQASAALAKQPGIAARWKAPILELDRKLRGG